jgi:hypothetical protein
MATSQCHCCLGQTAKGQIAANAGYSNKVTGNNEHDNNASPVTCCNYVMTGQMPVCDAGAARLCRGWQHQRYKDKNARVTRETMLVICWR